MTGVAVVCTGRHTHPETTAEPEDVVPPAPPGPDPAPPLPELIAQLMARPTPRRKRDSPAVVYRCPYVYPDGRPCGRQSERLGARRVSRLINAAESLRKIAIPGQVPLDISFM